MTPLLKATKDITILVVDDIADNLRLIATILELEGYQVRKARSGQLALRGVERHLPNLILLDIDMPGMDGYEVCKHLKATPKTAQVPIIFISALDQIQDKVRAFESGGLDYITKPFQDQEILIRVRNQLLIQQQQQQLEQQQQLLLLKNQQLEQEVQERLKAEAEIQRLAITDDLTGLLNRRGFLLMATQQLKVAQRNQDEIHLIFADVDGLKQVNDFYGHTVGDQLLLDAAEVIQATFREIDILARLGGDEFVALVSMAAKQEASQETSLEERLIRNITAFNQTQERQYLLAISFGVIACVRDSQHSLEDLIDQADRLMYENKKLKRKGSLRPTSSP